MSNIAHTVNLGKMNVTPMKQKLYTINGKTYLTAKTEDELRADLVAKGKLKPYNPFDEEEEAPAAGGGGGEPKKEEAPASEPEAMKRGIGFNTVVFTREALIEEIQKTLPASKIPKNLKSMLKGKMRNLLVDFKNGNL